MLSIIYDWQELVGAMLAVFSSVFLGALAFFYNKWNNRRTRLMVIDRLLVSSIKSTVETRDTLEIFYEKQFLPLRQSIVQDGKYIINLMFIPESIGSGFELDLSFMRTGSGYLDSNLLLCRHLSQDLDKGFEGAKNQLSETNKLYNELAISKTTSADEHAAHLVAALDSFSNAFHKVLVRHNCAVLIKKLVQTKIALDYYQRHKLLWRWKWRKSFRLLKKEKIEKGLFDDIDKYFEKDVEKLLGEIKGRKSEHQELVESVLG